MTYSWHRHHGTDVIDTTIFKADNVGTLVNIYKHIVLFRYHENHIINEWYRSFEKLPTGMIPL